MIRSSCSGWNINSLIKSYESYLDDLFLVSKVKLVDNGEVDNLQIMDIGGEEIGVAIKH